MEEKTNSEQLANLIVEGMQEKKASDIVVLNLTKVKNAVADYFVICTGNSDTQLDAISDSIEEVVWKGLKQDPWHREGRLQKEWVLLDYVDVVVHVFKKDRRDFFALEELWGDAEVVHVSSETEA
ncbi:MAG: ribosome silencing factor [Bacteroidetes bacterium]|nr:ribosome silencing factor [Bacteroidota bacterium]